MDFDRDKWINWSEMRIKSILHPESLTEQEREKTKFIPEYRKSKIKLLTEQINVLRVYERKKRVEDNVNSLTIANRLSQLTNFCYVVNKPFDKVTKEDLMGFFEYLQSERKCKLSTIDNYKSSLKSFFQWFYHMEEKDYPEIVKWIKRKNHRGLKLPEEILTEEDVLKMVEKASGLRDRAIIFLTYESGTRLGEIINLRLKHVTFDEYGGVLMVDGKTGQRRIRVINSVPSLKLWIEHHPFRDDPESPLWVCLNKNSYGKPLYRDGFVGIIKKAGKLAGIKKRVYAHGLRHARANSLSKLFSEQELKVFFGWVGSSQMAGVYTHLSGLDIDKKLLEKSGLLKEEQGTSDTLKPKKCGRCGMENPITAKYCSKCYNPMDIKEIEKIEMIKQAVAEYLYTKMSQDKEFEQKRKETES
jgi:integrase/ribosomal protein L40E